jgi:hypothetical protein
MTVRRIFLLAVLSCACSRVETGAAPEPTRERTAPELVVESPPVEAMQLGPAATLRCPATHEHGCSAVFRIPPTGGEAELFTLEYGIPNDMALTDGELLYASQVSFSTLVAYPKQARDLAERRDALRLLDASGSRIRRIASEGDIIVVALEQDLIAVPLDGSPRAVRSNTTSAYFVDVEGRDVVWSEDLGERAGRIMQVGDGTTSVVVEGEHRPQDVAIDASGVYWLNWGNGYYDPPGSVRGFPRGAAKPLTLAADQRAGRAITTDRDAVYWVVDGPEGRALRKVDKRGGDVVELVARTGREGVRGNHDEVRVFGDHVYFNAGDAVWQVGVDGHSPRVIAKVPDDNADIATFAVDDSGLYVAAQIYDPHEHESYDY